MKIALTGTPGTGKTSIAHILEKDYNIPIIQLHQFALEENLIEDFDEKRRSDIIDIDELNKRFIEKTYDEGIVIIDGHLSHFLKSVDMIIVLRCHPSILRTRLEIKQWSKEKIYENLEAEILDIIESEAVDIHTIERVIEIDTTNKKVEKLANIINSLIISRFKESKEYKPGQIDWTDVLMNDEFSLGV